MYTAAIYCDKEKPLVMFSGKTFWKRTDSITIIYTDITTSWDENRIRCFNNKRLVIYEERLARIVCV